MPFFTCFRPASNCGLISAMSCAGFATSRSSAGSTSLSEMKLTSTVTKSATLGKPRRIERADVGLFQRNDGRVLVQSRMQLLAPDIDRIDAPRAARQQHIGETAGRSAGIETDAARWLEPEMFERGRELQPAARDPWMVWRSDELRIRSDRVGSLAEQDAVRRHVTGRDRGLRPGAALEQAALDKDDIGALARSQARLITPIFSRPSASNTLATMPFWSRPALAYMAFGES